MENQTAYYPPVQPAGMMQTKPQTDIAAKKERRKVLLHFISFFRNFNSLESWLVLHRTFQAEYLYIPH